MKALGALVALLVGGCSSIPGLEGKLDNNLACAVAKDKLFLVSEYGPFSFGTKVRQADADVVCRPLPPPVVKP